MASINASTSGAGGVITTADNTGILNLQTAGTNAVTVDASQNVGIGTTSPGALLHTYTSTQESVRFARNSTASSAYVTFYANNASSTQVQYAGILGDVASSTAGSHGGNLLFYTTGSGTNAERMRIDSSGNVLMGTATPGVYSGGISRLEVATSASNTGAVTFKNASSNQQTISIWNAVPSSGTIYFIEFADGTTRATRGSITSNGSTTAYNTSSDYRLKENIAPMVGALDTVAALKPVTYKWKATGEDGQGFIAHELQAVLPDAVVGEKDAVDKEGNIKPQGVDTSFLVATLTAAIQELTARVIALEAK